MDAILGNLRSYVAPSPSVPSFPSVSSPQQMTLESLDISNETLYKIIAIMVIILIIATVIVLFSKGVFEDLNPFPYKEYADTSEERCVGLDSQNYKIKKFINLNNDVFLKECEGYKSPDGKYFDVLQSDGKYIRYYNGGEISSYDPKMKGAGPWTVEKEMKDGVIALFDNNNYLYSVVQPDSVYKNKDTWLSLGNDGKYSKYVGHNIKTPPYIDLSRTEDLGENFSATSDYSYSDDTKFSLTVVDETTDLDEDAITILKMIDPVNLLEYCLETLLKLYFETPPSIDDSIVVHLGNRVDTPTIIYDTQNIIYINLKTIVARYNNIYSKNIESIKNLIVGETLSKITNRLITSQHSSTESVGIYSRLHTGFMINIDGETPSEEPNVYDLGYFFLYIEKTYPGFIFKLVETIKSGSGTVDSVILQITKNRYPSADFLWITYQDELNNSIPTFQ